MAWRMRLSRMISPSELRATTPVELWSKTLPAITVRWGEERFSARRLSRTVLPMNRLGRIADRQVSG